ncbi:hypothetical protein VE03_02495 [Pseudogymnoascus sp. 23342-1-I1]|nr:hypothetical protein VE03_02495 [Pseudogymnoascus sp. 23342-1-I1]
MTEQVKSAGERPLWTSLNAELQNPPLHNLPSSLRTSDEEDLGTPFLLIPLATIPNVLELHPEPRHIFRLWQIFVENANPLIKIVHVPTLQQRILETSWTLETISKQTEALMFAIYLLAVASLSPADCQVHFGDDKATLLKRYRNGALQSLMAADLFSTRELEVLQAFVLFLLAAPNSETSTTLMAVAVRLAHKMGLHNDKTSFKATFFEKEMRTRLWWQIRCYSTRFLQAGTEDMGNVRMPLNLNDSELHPAMVTCPVEHVGATEMMYCLLKYEGARWQYMGRTANKVPTVKSSSTQAMILSDQAIRDLERTFEEKYLLFCDSRIPLHFLSLTMSRLAICRMRFMAYHPRGRADSGARMAPEERDVLFDQSVRLLELQRESRKTSFSSQLLTHMRRSHLEALIYMLYDLRGRPKGPRVVTAWRQVALFYEQHRESMDETENSFLDALGDLTLEAWQVRWKELVETQGGGGRVDDITPWYIKELQARHTKESMPINSASDDTITEALTVDLAYTTRLQLNVDATGQSRGEIDSEGLFLEMPVNFIDYPYDTDYWNEFWQT